MAEVPNSWLEKPKTRTERLAVELLSRIDDYCARKSWTEGYFSKLSAGDIGVVARLRRTGKVTVKKLHDIERYLNEHDK